MKLGRNPTLFWNVIYYSVSEHLNYWKGWCFGRINQKRWTMNVRTDMVRTYLFCLIKGKHHFLQFSEKYSSRLFFRGNFKTISMKSYTRMFIGCILKCPQKQSNPKKYCISLLHRHPYIYTSKIIRRELLQIIIGWHETEP